MDTPKKRVFVERRPLGDLKARWVYYFLGVVLFPFV